MVQLRLASASAMQAGRNCLHAGGVRSATAMRPRPTTRR